jgi:predicted permease
MRTRELRLIVRGLLRTPLYSLTAVLSLAVGIGATTAIFSMINRVLLRTLPVQDPGRLVFLYQPGPLQGSISSSEPGGAAFSYPMFREMQAQQTAFVSLAGAYSVNASLAYRGSASTGSALLVSGNYFETLGVGAAIGRVFDVGDDRVPGAHPLVVLSHAYWVSRFGADSSVLNETVIVNGRGMTVVGVARKGFAGETRGRAPDIFVPIAMKKEMTPDWDGLQDRLDAWVTLFARLKPDTTIGQTAAAINVTYHEQLRQDLALLKRPSPDFVRSFEAKTIVLRPGAYGRGQVRDQGKKPLFILLAMTGLVLLIACANVANLQLTRALARSRETAVRRALGASTGQIVAAVMLESTIIATTGAAAGLAVAHWTLQGVLAALPADAFGVGLLDAAVDLRMLLVALALAAGTSVVFGLYPALQSARGGLTASLRDQSGQATAGRSTGAFRNGLVTLQAAVSVLLLVSAGLFGKTLVNLWHVDLGMRTDHLLSFSIAPKLNGYSDDRVVTVYEDLRGRLAALPGVVSVTAARVAAINGSASSGNMSVEGFTSKGEGDADAYQNEVMPDYFRTLGIPLVAGREMAVSDRAGAPKVAVVNEAFVRHFIAGRDPIGLHVRRGATNPPIFDTEIVGVVKDAHYSGMREAPPPTFYSAYPQTARTRVLTVYVRTATRPERMSNAIRGAVAAIDPNLPVRALRTMDEQIDANTANERLLSILTGTFAALATLLAAIGLYGVLGFNVARRTREIGIRIALGATAPHVRGLVVRDAGVIIGIGLAAGLVAAWIAGGFIRSFLFETSPADPSIFASAALVLGAIALAAAYVPIRRATAVDPMVALRCE